MIRFGQKYGRILLILLLLGMQTLGPRLTVAAQDTAISLEAYWAMIGDIHKELIAADEDAGASRQEAAARLAAIREITLPDGRIQPIDHGFLIRQLQSEATPPEALDTLFATYLSSRLGWPDPAFPVFDDEELAKILSRSEFQYAPPEEPNFLQRLWQDIRQRVEDFFLQLFPADAMLRLPLNNLILLAAAALVLAALLFALRGLVADLTADSAIGSGGGLNGADLTAERALQRAQELSSGGDYRTAVRYLYLSALLLLEDRGLLRYDRSLTNREYLRSVAHRPELAAILHEVIEVFDRVWYGFQTLNAAEYEQYTRRVERLKQQKEPK